MEENNILTFLAFILPSLLYAQDRCFNTTSPFPKSVADRTLPPYSQIGAFFQHDGTLTCSAFAFDSTHVLTAGHCVQRHFKENHEKEILEFHFAESVKDTTKKWKVKSIAMPTTFFNGQYDLTQDLWPIQNLLNPTQRMPEGTVPFYDVGMDWALVELSTELPLHLILPHASAELGASKVLGYPYLIGGTRLNHGNLYESTGEIIQLKTRDHKDTLMEHNVCIGYGHSGSPILQNGKTVGINILLGKGKNYAIRFDDTFFNLIREAAAQEQETLNSSFWKIQLPQE
ncbi:MAG: trypsin-like serine protease [Xanthomonadaceae bacterium]|nr:trypsin-like serine protease [Xanthomonadaceae bacterium]